MSYRGPKLLSSLTLVILAVLSASAATGASASTTAYTCASTASGAQFSDAHCLTKSSGVGYKHVVITGLSGFSATDLNTSGETTAGTPVRIKGTVSGVETEISCTATSGSGLIGNSEKSGEMIVHMTGSLTYSFCSVNKPAGKSCKAPVSITLPFTATTEGQGAALKFTPVEGTEFVGITISGCTVAALNKTFPLSGTFTATPSGATVSTTHAGITGQGTLTFGGQVAGLQGSVTFTGESFAGLTFT